MKSCIHGLTAAQQSKPRGMALEQSQSFVLPRPKIEM
jgi:hypothetical protein